jgi:hypothetical protein
MTFGLDRLIVSIEHWQLWMFPESEFKFPRLDFRWKLFIIRWTLHGIPESGQQSFLGMGTVGVHDMEKKKHELVI